MLEGTGVFASLARSLRLGALTGKLVEVNLVLGIVRLALIVLAMVFSAIPLPFEADMTGTAALPLVGHWSRCSTWSPAISSRSQGWPPSSNSGGSTILTRNRDSSRSQHIPASKCRRSKGQRRFFPSLPTEANPEKLERGYFLDRHPGFRQPIHTTHRPPHTRAERLLRGPSLQRFVAEIRVPSSHRAHSLRRSLLGLRPGRARADPGMLAMGLPILGICYGLQFLTHHFGGKVRSAEKREYGHAAGVDRSRAKREPFVCRLACHRSTSGCRMGMKPWSCRPAFL